MQRVELPFFAGGSRDVNIAGLVVTPAELARAMVIPPLVDLCCEPGFPGFPVRETPESLIASAVAGGFGALLLSPRVDPILDTPEQLSRVHAQLGGVSLCYAGALTRGLRATELSEAGLLQQAGAVALSDGGVAHRDTVVLKNALEYAAAFGLLVVLRPCDADLDEIGVVHDSSLAANLGMRGNSAANEEIGVSRIWALVRATGARVHLTHIGTAAGARMIALARAEGLPISGSTPARNLVLVEDDLDDSHYNARYRLHPPLRTKADRAALIAAVREQNLLVAADHQPRAPEEKDHEFERAVPGSAGLRTAFAATFTALGDLGLAVAACSEGPGAVLARAVSGWTLFDPAGETMVPTTDPCDALGGRVLRGRVLGFCPET